MDHFPQGQVNIHRLINVWSSPLLEQLPRFLSMGQTSLNNQQPLCNEHPHINRGIFQYHSWIPAEENISEVRTWFAVVRPIFADLSLKCLDRISAIICQWMPYKRPRNKIGIFCEVGLTSFEQGILKINLS